jgi:hypothetical protein
MDLLNLAVGKIIKPLDLWNIAAILFFQKLHGFIKR